MHTIRHQQLLSGLHIFGEKALKEFGVGSGAAIGVERHRRTGIEHVWASHQNKTERECEWVSE
jgi:hypothetical protein